MNYEVPYLKCNEVLKGFTHSNWSGCTTEGRSYSGYTFCNGPIAWESRMQRTVALSSIEAEFMALTEAAN